MLLLKSLMMTPFSDNVVMIYLQFSFSCKVSIAFMILSMLSSLEDMPIPSFNSLLPSLNLVEPSTNLLDPSYNSFKPVFNSLLPSHNLEIPVVRVVICILNVLITSSFTALISLTPNTPQSTFDITYHQCDGICFILLYVSPDGSREIKGV